MRPGWTRFLLMQALCQTRKLLILRLARRPSALKVAAFHHQSALFQPVSAVERVIEC